jgi:hypothetical protein
MLPDESLTSWLARAALGQGCDPMTLTGSLWPTWRVWTRDTDRGIDPARLPALSSAAGLPAAVIENAALKGDARLIAGGPLPAEQPWPWITTLGKRNRKHSSGLAFCPACLADDGKPYFRRKWRFAWQTACETHGIILHDHCPACSAPVQPHRLLAEDRRLAVCAFCRADLGKTPVMQASAEELALIRLANKTLRHGDGEFWDHTLPANTWFAALRLPFCWVRVAARRDSSALAAAFRELHLDIEADAMPVSGLPFEGLAVTERRVLVSAAARLIIAGPDRVVECFLRSGVTAGSLVQPRESAPSPIAQVLAALPERRLQRPPHQKTATVRPKSRRTVLAAWARLTRRIAADV